MIINSNQRIFSSRYAPDPKLNVLWMDLTADPDGAIIKYYDAETGTYLRLSGEGDSPGGTDGLDGRSPYIGPNNNWFIFNDNLQTYQDSGVSALGEDGAVFTPSVGSSGVLTWTNNGGLQNPSAVNIKGSDGKTAFESAVDGGYTGTESEFNAKLAADAEIITTDEGTAISVGYIPAGTNLEGKTISEVIDQMLYKELYPNYPFTVPSSSFTTTVNSLQKIGSTINIPFTTQFSRGAITPAYGTDGYRSGIPTKYEYTGTGLTTVTDETANLLVNNQTVSSYTILAGANAWTSKVYYSQGDRPLSSRGNTYSEDALPAGSVSTKTITITGVYPIIATTVDTNTLTEQPTLLSNGSDVVISFAKEDIFSSVLKKQVIKIPKAWKSGDAFLTQAYQRDDQTGLYGTTNIMSSFTQSAGTGGDSNYNIYTHNGGQIGARTIKFKV